VAITENLKIITANGLSLADLLASPVPAAPVRDIRPSRANVRGLKTSQFRDTPSKTESLLELDFLTLVEFDPRVRDYATQPFAITWPPTSTKTRRYTPDVLVRYIPRYLGNKDGAVLKNTIFEIKPCEVLKKDWLDYKPKFKAAIRLANEHGLRFKVLTEKQIRTVYLKNVRFLRGYTGSKFDALLHDPVVFEKQLVLRQKLFSLGESTPKALLAAISSNPHIQADYIPWLWNLLAKGRVVHADLHNAGLTMAMPLKSGDTAQSLRLTQGSLKDFLMVGIA
jgi:hypothetical protein